MPSVFLVSDTHFGHMGVCRFTRNDGVTKLRPWDSPEEMDEAMIRAWNERVKPTDKVYHLGDVIINRRAFSTLARLNGDKVLIRGNHDIFRDDEYRQYFRELRAYHVVEGMIFSHIPLHSDKRHWALNYIIDPGGTAVKTGFHKLAGEPTLQPPSARAWNAAHSEEICSVVLEPFRWHIINTHVLHSVTGVTGTRKAVTLGLNRENPFDDIKNYSGLLASL